MISGYDISPDDQDTIIFIQKLGESEKNAIAVCNYFPIDCSSFNPVLHQPHYRRAGHEHPFSETGYPLVDIGDQVKINTSAEWVKKIRVFDFSQNSAMWDNLMKGLQELEHTYKPENKQPNDISSNKTKKPSKNLERYQGNFLTNGKELVYFDENHKKTSIKTLEGFHETLFDDNQDAIDITYETLKNQLLETVPIDDYFKIKVFVRHPGNKINLSAFEYGSYYIVDIDDNDSITKVTAIEPTEKKQKDCKYDLSIQKNNQPLDCEYMEDGLHFLSIKEFESNIECTKLTTKDGDTQKNRVEFYKKNNSVFYRYKTLDDKIVTKELEVNAELNNDKMSYAKNIYADANLKKLEIGNKIYNSLYTFNIFKSKKPTASVVGLNKISIGGEKIETSGDNRKMIGKENNKSIRELEDNILKHKIKSVNRVVKTLDMNFTASTTNEYENNPSNAMHININQLQANYPCVMINLDIALTSTCEGIKIDKNMLHNNNNNEEQTRLLESVNKYHLSVTKTKDDIEVPCVQYVKNDNGLIKLTNMNVNIKEESKDILLNAIKTHAVTMDMLTNALKERVDIPSTKNYSRFLTHLLIAFINYELYKAKIGVYFDKRSSFGFLSPTATDTGDAVRLSLGLIPNEAWENCVIAGIQKCSQMVSSLMTDTQFKGGLPHLCDEFDKSNFASYGHKVFLESLIDSTLDDTPDLSELNKIINALNSKSAINNLEEKYENNDGFKSLTEKLSKNLDMKIEAASEEFKSLYQDVNQIYDQMFMKMQLNTINITNKNNEETNLMHVKMTALRNKIDEFRHQSYLALQNLTQVGISSESEDEHDNNKHFTPSGMSALALPLFAYKISNGNHNPQNPVYFKRLPYAYFELSDFDKHIHDDHFKSTEDTHQASVMYYDHNPCVTESSGEPVKLDSQVVTDFLSEQNTVKLFIVDVTSSTTKQKNEIRSYWEKNGGNHILCFAESALKNRQLGLDMAHYGIIKVVCNNPGNELYNNLKTKLRELSKGTSSVYSTIMRRQFRETAEENASANIINTMSNSL